MSALSPPPTQTATAELLWVKALDSLRQDGKSYALSWLEQMNAVAAKEGALVLGVPDRFFRDWIDDHYRALLEEEVTRHAGAPTRIEFEVVQNRPAPTELSHVPAVNTEPHRPHRLLARFTFDSYVVGDSNQLPAAACAAVGDSPGRCYNPLFIYGGTGLGKTHLLHAVGNKVLSNRSKARILYLSSEEFTNEYIESVRGNRMSEFRRKYREECDLLLIDDVQFLGKREETQKEFFYTFNSLHEMGKAIVLTADTVPAEIPGLEDRLRSRFAMGLITDIQAPNFETRVAILRKKADADGLPLMDKVAHFIARHVQRNVRELEGALIKLAAVHSLSRQPVTEELAGQVLKDLLPTHQPLDMETIQREVARYYKVAAEDLRQDRRMKQLAHARAVAMYLCRKMTKSSFPEIGQRFNKDHSTVISAVRKVESQRDADAQVRKELEELELKLGHV